MLFGWSAMIGDDPDFVVIEGGAPGADTAAAEWHRAFYGHRPDQHEQYPADWEKHGKAAGPIRNQQMLDEGKPDIVFAFKNEFGVRSWPRGGTEDMVARAKAAGIPYYIVSRG